MAIKNYTTQIAAARTIAEIQQMLGEHGAHRIGLDYQDKQVAGITFQIEVDADVLTYRLPCRWQGIYELLKDDARAQQVMRDKKIKFGDQHCRAVGWRIVRDWLDAQLALIEAEMADLKEVMLPYMLTRTGATVYQVLDGGRRLLTDGNER